MPSQGDAMFRKMLVVAMVVPALLAPDAWGQEEHPAAEHAMPGAHSPHEHEMHAEHADEGMSMEEEFPQSENFLVWIIGALGWRYAFLLPVSALLSFALTALLVIAGKGRTTGPALAFIVAIPFLIGLFGMFDGLMASFMVIAHSTAAPKPSVYAQGMSMSIVTPLLGMLLMVPSYLLATAGLTIRALKNDPKP